MKGFFSRSQITATRRPLPLVAKCGQCGLYKGCKTPFMKPTGKSTPRVLIVGEAPGEDEDNRGIQFVGKAGQHVRDRIRKLGYTDTNYQIHWTNALICRPPNNVIKDKNSLIYCRPNLLQTIKELRPEVIIPLGYSPVKSLIGHLWKEDTGGINRWYGWQIPSQEFNCWVCPTWHPSYLLRKKEQVRDMYFDNHLKAALALRGRPWKKVPDYRSMVQTTRSEKEAVDFIKELMRRDDPVAFDYETNCLKPDSHKSRIVCCSVSNGKMTLAFPWMGKIIKWMKKFLRSKVPKIASNMKFEHRWSKIKLGIEVRNWDIDTMLLSHVLDNRPDINSIKFQSFVLLGQGDYDSHIHPFLKATGGGYALNRIDECNLDDLMFYCGMDSLLEWHVAKKQRRLLRVLSKQIEA